VDADEILVMEAGRVVERGTHTQLLQNGGRYEHMWRTQSHQTQAAPGVTTATAAQLAHSREQVT
jgi:ATP-binding cassette subfamily B protein